MSVPQVRARFLSANLGETNRGHAKSNAASPFGERQFQVMNSIGQGNLVNGSLVPQVRSLSANLGEPGRLTQEQMNVLRHDNIPIDANVKADPHVFETLNEKIEQLSG